MERAFLIIKKKHFLSIFIPFFTVKLLKFFFFKFYLIVYSLAYDIKIKYNFFLLEYSQILIKF